MQVPGPLAMQKGLAANYTSVLRRIGPAPMYVGTLAGSGGDVFQTAACRLEVEHQSVHAIRYRIRQQIRERIPFGVGCCTGAAAAPVAPYTPFVAYTGQACS